MGRCRSWSPTACSRRRRVLRSVAVIALTIVSALGTTACASRSPEAPPTADSPYGALASLNQEQRQALHDLGFRIWPVFGDRAQIPCGGWLLWDAGDRKHVLYKDANGRTTPLPDGDFVWFGDESGTIRQSATGDSGAFVLLGSRDFVFVIDLHEQLAGRFAR